MTWHEIVPQSYAATFTAKALSKIVSLAPSIVLTLHQRKLVCDVESPLQQSPHQRASFQTSSHPFPAQRVGDAFGANVFRHVTRASSMPSHQVDHVNKQQQPTRRRPSTGSATLQKKHKSATTCNVVHPSSRCYAATSHHQNEPTNQ